MALDSKVRRRGREEAHHDGLDAEIKYTTLRTIIIPETSPCMLVIPIIGAKLQVSPLIKNPYNTRSFDTKPPA